MPTFSSLLSGLIFIQKIAFLTKIYNSILYHRINAHVEKKEYIAKEASLPRDFQNHLNHSSSSNFSVLMRSPGTSGVRKQSWAACSNLLLYRHWKRTSILTGKWLIETQLHSILLSRFLLVQAGGKRFWLQLVSRGSSSVFSLRLITACAHSLYCFSHSSTNTGIANLKRKFRTYIYTALRSTEKIAKITFEVIPVSLFTAKPEKHFIGSLLTAISDFSLENRCSWWLLRVLQKNAGKLTGP